MQCHTARRLQCASCDADLNNLWLVAGADGEDLEESTAGPQQFLVGIESHDPHQVHWTSTGQDYQLQEHTHSHKLLTTVLGNGPDG